MDKVYLLNIEDEDNEANREFGFFDYTPIEAYSTPEDREARIVELDNLAKSIGRFFITSPRDLVIGEKFDVGNEL